MKDWNDESQKGDSFDIWYIQTQNCKQACIKWNRSDEYKNLVGKELKLQVKNDDNFDKCCPDRKLEPSTQKGKLVVNINLTSRCKNQDDMKKEKIYTNKLEPKKKVKYHK